MKMVSSNKKLKIEQYTQVNPQIVYYSVDFYNKISD